MGCSFSSHSSSQSPLPFAAVLFQAGSAPTDGTITPTPRAVPQLCRLEKKSSPAPELPDSHSPPSVRRHTNEQPGQQTCLCNFTNQPLRSAAQQWTTGAVKPRSCQNRAHNPSTPRAVLCPDIQWDPQDVPAKHHLHAVPSSLFLTVCTH